MQRLILEKRLRHGEQGFAATYLTLRGLRDTLESPSGIADSQTVLSLAGVLKDPKYTKQTQAFFLYREAAETIVAVMKGQGSHGLIKEAFATLTGTLETTQGPQHRAATEALGTLPLQIRGPKPNGQKHKSPCRATLSDILAIAVFSPNGGPTLAGRNLVFTASDKDQILVVKLAKGQEAATCLLTEAIWMAYLRGARERYALRFDIPTPLKIRGSYVVQLDNMSSELSKKLGGSLNLWAMSYLTTADYFSYPNDDRPEKRLPAGDFREVMFRNAWLFGKLAAEGMVHRAPIPLFHNRVQRARRTDGGLYEWQRGGRLDRWLDSCAFPNFGLSGVRDFEHFDSFHDTNRQLYAAIGTHLLSLFLTTGSYFRNKDSARVGFTTDGNPVDARDLFDTGLFEEILNGIFVHYYRGFTGHDDTIAFPGDLRGLTLRMVEEMGIDHHMEEVLRVADQQEMTQEAFQAFLTNRGFTKAEADRCAKGEKDIIIHTGPHLGGFNERISIPELIDAIGAMSALCIGSRWLRMRLDHH